ncbi:Rpn family recombination-promoting nuclease/putative transposase [Shigella sonnei]
MDITITPDDEIMQHRRIAIFELLQKHIRQRDLMLLLEQLVTLIDEGYTSGSELVAMRKTICCNAVILNKRICFMVC